MYLVVKAIVVRKSPDQKRSCGSDSRLGYNVQLKTQKQMIWKILLTIFMYLAFFWCADKLTRLAKKAILNIIEARQKKANSDIDDEEDMGFFDGEAFLFDDDNSQHILMS